MGIIFKKLSDIQFLAILLIISVLFVLSVMILLFYYFVGRHQPIAIDSEPWGQFGDFFGGVLNPIISLVNMYLLYRFFRLESSDKADALKAEKERHSEVLRNSVVPWGDFYLGLTDKIEIKFKNHGNGPMVITKIEFIKNGRTELIEIEKLVPDPTQRYHVYKEVNILTRGETLSLSKDSELLLLCIKSPDILTDRGLLSHFDSWLSELSQFNVSIEYEDIYKSKFSKSCSLKHWGEVGSWFSERYKL